MNHQQTLINDLQIASDNMLEALSKFSQQQINKVPFKDSWTAGQVAEHILKSATGLPDVLHGDKEPTQRPPDEKEAIIKSIFLNFSTKLKSPDFIIPSNDIHDKQELLKAVQAALDNIKKAATEVNPQETCTSFPLPQLGTLTGGEWLCFVASHVKRHTNQLNNIYQAMSAAA